MSALLLVAVAGHGACVSPPPPAFRHPDDGQATPALIYFAGTLEIFLPQKSRVIWPPMTIWHKLAAPRFSAFEFGVY
jgi:hypothetical protein